MTRDEILNMPAGREMDALIAVFIGWVIEDNTAISQNGGKWARNVHGDDGWLPYYSTDIAAAWQVVEKLKEKWEIVDVWHQRNVGLDWFCEVVGNGTGEFANENTTPLAICRAALLTTLKD